MASQLVLHEVSVVMQDGRQASQAARHAACAPAGRLPHAARQLAVEPHEVRQSPSLVVHAARQVVRLVVQAVRQVVVQVLQVASAVVHALLQPAAHAASVAMTAASVAMTAASVPGEAASVAGEAASVPGEAASSVAEAASTVDPVSRVVAASTEPESRAAPSVIEPESGPPGPVSLPDVVASPQPETATSVANRDPRQSVRMFIGNPFSCCIDARRSQRRGGEPSRSATGSMVSDHRASLGASPSRPSERAELRARARVSRRVPSPRAEPARRHLALNGDASTADPV